MGPTFTTEIGGGKLVFRRLHIVSFLGFRSFHSPDGGQAQSKAGRGPDPQTDNYSVSQV